MKRYLLVYDADCGPCTRFKRSVEFLDSYHSLAFLSLREADDKGLLRTIAPELRHGSFHLLSPSGGYQSGADAIPRLISLLPSGSLVSKVMTLAPAGGRTIRFVYSAFSRLHDSGSCGYQSRSGGPHSKRLQPVDDEFGYMQHDESARLTSQSPIGS